MAGAGPGLVWAGAERPGLSAPRILRVVDGFLRSRGLGADLIPPLSLVTDDLGMPERIGKAPGGEEVDGVVTSPPCDTSSAFRAPTGARRCGLENPTRRQGRSTRGDPPGSKGCRRSRERDARPCRFIRWTTRGCGSPKMSGPRLS